MNDRYGAWGARLQGLQQIGPRPGRILPVAPGSRSDPLAQLALHQALERWRANQRSIRKRAIEIGGGSRRSTRVSALAACTSSNVNHWTSSSSPSSARGSPPAPRSEEHTSALQSPRQL